MSMSMSLAANAAKVAKVGAPSAARAMSGLAFQLSDSQKEFQQLARRFAKEEMIPKAAECASPALPTSNRTTHQHNH